MQRRVERSAFRVILGSIVVVSALAAGAAGHTVTTAVSAQDPKETTRFSCNDRIYVRLVWDAPLQGVHTLRGVWRNTVSGYSHTTEIRTEPGVPASWLW